ncbi:MAG: aldehyde-activating protein, partial [Cyanobacteria bacterium J06626_23]
VYPTEAVQVTQGKLVTWTLKTLPRQRCATCGTHIMAEVPDLNQCGIKANLLPLGAFQPDFHLHCRYAMLPVKDNLPHFKDLPTSFGGSDKTVSWSLGCD